jgi:hypothetical protein
VFPVKYERRFTESTAEGVIRMIWLARLKPLVAVATILIIATAGVVVQGRQQPTAGGTQGQAKTPTLPTKTPPDPTAAAVPDLAADRAIARKQLAVIDEAWAFLKDMYKNARMGVDEESIGPWGRRRLEALRRAGAGKAEIVAALEKYISDLEWFQEIAHTRIEHFHPTYGEYEIKFLRIEAEIWLNEEKAR